MTIAALLLLLLPACTGPAEPSGLPPEALAAQQALETALTGDDIQAVSTAARAASTWRGQDPALDRALGDALANHLLHVDEGVTLLRSVAAPDDPAWVEAARGAALRSGDRAWLAELLALPAPDGLDWKGLSLEHPVVEQVVDAARTDASVDLALLHDLLADCTLLDRRPQLGRRQVDLPLPASLMRTLHHLGATEVLVARTQLAKAASTHREPVWHCETGWLTGQYRREIPIPLPPHGVIVAASNGWQAAWLELDPRPEGPWATVATDGPSAARWVLAARVVDEALAEGLTEEAALARATERFGPGLFLPGSTAGQEPTTPPAVTE